LKPFSLEEYQQLVSISEVLEQDGHGLKVLKTSEDLMVKIFRRKRLVSSALLKSYAARFVENARKLESLGFNTVDIVDVYYCRAIKRALVLYHPLPGETLRTTLQMREHNDELMERFIQLLARMHEKGVFFRSCHFGNIIVAASMDSLGLIDIADMKILPESLSIDRRLRNFRHLARYAIDRESINTFGIDNFIDVYYKSCQISDSYKIKFIDVLRRAITE
jgi:tRNA A-37 threonylcarbamoyl transferase component Bud32